MPADPPDFSRVEGPEEPTALASVLCPNCLHGNFELADFCARCGAPLSFLATVDPFKQTLSEGFAYRQAVEGPPRRIVLIGVWLLFTPGLLALPVVWARGEECLPFTVSFVLSAVILCRTTANYLRKRRLDPPSPAV